MLIKERLSSQEEMTAVDKLLADYFLKSGREIKLMSSRAIASQLYVAPSTVSRFCQEIGFSGYNDFKEAFLAELDYLDRNFQDIDPNFPFTEKDMNIGLASKMATLYEQIRRSHVRSPLKGVILEKYAEAGEITAPGRPLAKLADLSVVRLKVYVSGAQLGKVKTGAPCTVRIDDGEKDYRSFPGTVSHVSDKAEFTPKIIQTREERVTLVYAVTIDVANDGSMKPGMPGEALF